MAVYNNRFLAAASAYQADTANAQTIKVGNLGMGQDILSLRLSDIIGTLSAEEQLEREREQERQSEDTLTLLIAAGAIAVLILWILK